jgi:hypothetical protein
MEGHQMPQTYHEIEAQTVEESLGTLSRDDGFLDLEATRGEDNRKGDPEATVGR